MTATTNHRIRFMDNNLANIDSANVTYSSQMSLFPATNVYQNTFRHKVWRPSGHFLIEAGVNDKVYINDGSDKTATVAASAYTTPDLLATAIQTALNAVSSGWTVTYVTASEEYKFRFAHASAHTLRTTVLTEAIWETIGFEYPLDQVITTQILGLEQRCHTSEYLIFDLGANYSINFFGLIAPIDVVFPISTTQSTVTLKANNINDFTAPPLSVTLSVETTGIYRFLDDIDDTAYRYWKFEYEDKTNTLGPTGFDFAVLYLGDYVTFVNRSVSTGFSKQMLDTSTASTAESGALYFNRRNKYVRFNGASIQYLNKTQRDTLEEMFYRLGTTTPFFVSFDPTQCWTNNLHDFTKYVIFDGSPVYTSIVRDLFSVGVDFREVI